MTDQGPTTLAEFQELVAASPDDVLGHMHAILALARNNPADALRHLAEAAFRRPACDAEVKQAVLALAEMVGNGSVSPAGAAAGIDAMAHWTRCGKTAEECRAGARWLRMALAPQP